MDDDDFGLSAEIKKAERERDWVPLAVFALCALFAWISGQDNFGAGSSVFVGLGFMVALRAIYQNRVTVLRLEKRREFIARKEKEADSIFLQPVAINHSTDISR